MIPVVYDNIIFTLQRSGGISVVWNELLRRARADREITLTELDYTTHHRWMERYRIPDYKVSAPTIFHSSYFRILPQQGVYNITTVHDLTYHLYRHGLAKAVHLWEEERALRHSEAIICVSEHTKRDLLHFYPWVKEEQVYVVYNGVGEEFFPIPSAKKKGYLLFVGNSTAAYKRLDIAQAVARMTGLKLVNVTNVPREEMNRYYNEALCLLYPSDYEGFGLPILEAQKAGCPVIAQASSSIPEVIGAQGWTIRHDTPQRMAEEMAKQVRELLSRPATDLIEAGITNAARFSWEKTYAQTKQVYESIYHHHHL